MNPEGAGAQGSVGVGDDPEDRSTAPRVQYTSLDEPAFRSNAVEGFKFEYLDHTADVQLHAWGDTLQEAFEQVALAMYHYMVPLDHVGVEGELTREFSVQGHDLHSLLFAFLDELLFVFSTDLLVCREVTITSFDRDSFTLTAVGRGETFDRGRHEAGTEVKAITYSAMQIVEREGDAEVFVIVDI
mmetsp:Transcript_7513/g.16297  ORF Transcript_7513/g.16297 Transcript_7513/m.16297 type:complete len:186 (-) Transcript_7513:707-1264(-)